MTFGENLRREREMRGVELREIAEATKISIRFLQAIEADRPDVLPGGLFPQAFVRQYARHLGLDADKVVADFTYAHRAGGGPVSSEKAVSGPEGSHALLPRLAAVAAAALVALGLAAWGTRGSDEPPPAPAAPASPPAAVVRAEDRVYPPPSMSATAPAADPDALVLTLEPRQSCWVKVQVDRLTVLNRTLAEGEKQTFEARKEIVLGVGNAGGLAFTINGRPGIPLGKEGEVKSNIVITRETLGSLVESGGGRAPVRPLPSAAAPERPLTPVATATAPPA